MTTTEVTPEVTDEVTTTEMTTMEVTTASTSIGTTTPWDAEMETVETARLHVEVNDPENWAGDGLPGELSGNGKSKAFMSQSDGTNRWINASENEEHYVVCIFRI